MKSTIKRLLGLLLAIPSLYRRWWFVTRAKLMAKAMGVKLDISVDRRVLFGRNVTLKLEGGNPITIRIGPNVIFEDDVRMEIRNNIGHNPTLVIEGEAIFHTRAVMFIGGKLWFRGKNEIGVGTVIRCSQYIEWGVVSGTGEYASIYDFLHGVDEKRTRAYQASLISSPIKIGDWVLIAAKATVNPGTTLAEMTIVAPNSVVSGAHVKPGDIVAGIPAKSLDKPEMFPVFDNPFILAVASWLGDEPGPGFKTVEEARASTPDPEPYIIEKHGWNAILVRLEERAAARAKENGAQEKAESKAD